MSGDGRERAGVVVGECPLHLASRVGVPGAVPRASQLAITYIYCSGKNVSG